MPSYTLHSPAQVHEEFKQNIENISVEMLLRKFAESKGTGREKPGESGYLLGSSYKTTAAWKEQDSRQETSLGLSFLIRKMG